MLSVQCPLLSHSENSMYTWRAEQAYGALSYMRKCSWYFQGEVTSTDELHCVATAMERAWEDHGRHTSEGNWAWTWKLGFVSLFLTFLCLPSFQHWAWLTFIGEINLNLKTKNKQRWSVWPRYVCIKSSLRPAQCKETEVVQERVQRWGDRGLLEGKGANTSPGFCRMPHFWCCFHAEKLSR